MNKLFFASLISIISVGATNAATIPWWEQPTICRLSPANCYTGMGAGFDSGMWDAGANCWGLKFICPEATTDTTDRQPILMGRNEIAAGKGISPDFDTSILNDDCFGVRKTIDNGTRASVGGKYVNVWCNGVLDNADENLPNGEISLTSQPTCNQLAQNEYVATLNGKCYGKRYNSNDYVIECGANLLPTRLIVLNGADYSTSATNTPKSESDANAIFDKMESVSKTQRAKYY